MGAQFAPFLNTMLRKEGLCTAYTSDFAFEVLFQGPKQYIAIHGKYWNVRQLKRMSMGSL